MVISIVIPIFNEASGLSELHSRLSSVLKNLTDKQPEYQFEILFVDDGSTDDTLLALKRLQSIDSRIHYLSFARNFGHQIALTAGLEHASGQAVISMDGDLQHPPEMIPQFLELWRAGYDIVDTLRAQTESATLFKRASSRFFYILFRRLAGVDLPSGTADFRLLDRKVVYVLNGIKERSRFLRGLILWVGFKRYSLVYKAPERFAGTSKYSFLKMLLLALDGISSFSAKPLYFSIFVGIFFAFAGLGYLLYALTVFFFFPSYSVPGWTSLISVILIVGGVQLLVLGVIGFYIGKIYEEVKNRPLYIVRENSHRLS